MPKMLLEVG